MALDLSALASLNEDDLKSWSADDVAYVLWQTKWAMTARPNQLPPATSWTEAGFMAGRGFGKTRVGAEWLAAASYEDPDAFPSAVIAPTYGDVKFTCFEGPAGLLNVMPKELLVRYNSSDMIIEMKTRSGKTTTIRGFTAEKPERLRGPQHARIWCFVPGTHVATPQGSQPIEELRPGDTVMTRKGPRRVLANSVRRKQPVGEVSFSNGAKLVGTGDHPVYRLKSGWTRLDQLQVGDLACAINASNGVRSAGTATRAATTNELTKAPSRSGLFGFIGRCGKASMAQFLWGTTCITPMRTKATTGLKTLNAYLTERTRRTILLAVRYPERIGQRLRKSLCLAPIAGNCSLVNVPPPTPAAFGAISAGRMLGGKAPNTASIVKKSSGPVTGTFAVSVASTWQPQGEQSVYCLKVEGEPEYFANGILVHNCDELSSWAYDEDTWDMAMMGLRLGNNPQILWTTTPKPKELVRKLIEPKKGRFIVRGSTFENKANLPDSFFAQLEQYEGTTLGRQELYGELIDPEESGIIKRSWFRMWPAKKPLPNFDWIIMSMDTAFTEATFDKKNGADSSACVVIGVFMHEEIANLIVLDCWSEQLGLPDLMKRVKREMNNRYGDDEDTAMIRPMFGSAKPMTSGRAPDILLIEDKGSGISLRQMLAREGIEAYAYNPGRADKLTRLHIVSPVFAQKRVWLPESDKFKGRPKTWLEPMLAQLCAFTGAGSIKHDDYVDSMSQAVRLCMDKGMVTTVKASEEKRRNTDSNDRRSAPREYSNPYAA